MLNTNSLMPARSAYGASTMGRKTQVQKQLDKIVGGIRQSAQEGKFSLECEGRLHPEVETALAEAGYKVQGSAFPIISWDHATTDNEGEQ